MRTLAKKKVDSLSGATVKTILNSVPRNNANLEAEKGETAITTSYGPDIPEHYVIEGKKHKDGGTPLNLKEGSFVFSDSKDLLIKDKDTLKSFGITNKNNLKKGLTPAKIAERFDDLNDAKKVLLDNNSSNIEKTTASAALNSSMEQLSKLAIIQESMKDFPQGIPMIAKPYLEKMGISENDLLQQSSQAIQETDTQKAEFGLTVNNQIPPQELARLAREAQQKYSSIMPSNQTDAIINSLYNNNRNSYSPVNVIRTAIDNRNVQSDYRNTMPNSGNQNLTASSGNDQVKKDLNNASNSQKLYARFGQFDLTDALLAGVSTANSFFDNINGLRRQGQIAKRFQGDLMFSSLPAEDRGDYIVSGGDYGDFRPNEQLPTLHKPITPNIFTRFEGGGQISNLYNSLDKNSINDLAKFFNGGHLSSYASGGSNAINTTPPDNDDEKNKIAKKLNQKPENIVIINNESDIPYAAKQNEGKILVLKTDKGYSTVSPGKSYDNEDMKVAENLGFQNKGYMPVVATMYNKNKLFNNAIGNLITEAQNDKNFDISKYVGKFNLSFQNDKNHPDQTSQMDLADYFDKTKGNGTVQDRYVQWLKNYQKGTNNAFVTTVNLLQYKDQQPSKKDDESFHQQVQGKLLDALSGKQSGPVILDEQLNEQGFKQYLQKADLASTAKKIYGDNNYQDKFFSKQDAGATVGSDNSIQNQSQAVKDFQSAHQYNANAQNNLFQKRGVFTFETGKTKNIDNSNTKISPVDAIIGTQTSGQHAGVANYTTSPFSLDEPKSTDTPAKSEDKVSADDKSVDKPVLKSNYAPFWKQDLVNMMGAYGDYNRIKRQYPWEAVPDLMLPRPTYVSPERALAANAEQANTLTTTAAILGNPQSFASTAMGVQGKSLENAANIAAQYNNKNVDVANQFEGLRSQLFNAYASNKADRDQNLYNENLMMEANYLHDKNIAQKNMRNLFVNALTNRANTYNQNQINPHFQINPADSGMINYYKQENLNPNYTPDKNEFKMVSDMIDQSFPGLTTKEKAEAVINYLTRNKPRGQYISGYPQHTTPIYPTQYANPMNVESYGQP